MIDSIMTKMGLVIVILGLLIGFWQWDRQQAYYQGYNKRSSEISDEKDKALAELDEMHLKDLKRIQEAHDAEIEELSKINETQEALEVIKYVYKNIETKVYSCERLGSEFVSVFNSNRSSIFGGQSNTD